MTLTLDAILEQYDKGTLAEQPDLALHDALVKVNHWHEWRKQHPNDPPSSVPPTDELGKVATFLENHSQRRYGCNRAADRD